VNQSVASVRQRFFIQAAITGIFALLPSNAGNSNWLAITLVLAAGSAGVGAALGSLGSAAYQTAVGWEVLAVLIGGYGLTQNTYIPGTIIGVAALIRLLDGNVKAAFSAAATIPTGAQQYSPPPYSPAQQFGAPGPQFGAPAPQYAPGTWPPPPPPSAPPQG
jgi:hypothetical protein